MTNPGLKNVVSFFNSAGLMEADALAHPSEDLDRHGVMIIDPTNPLRRKKLVPGPYVNLLEPVLSKGEPVSPFPSLEQIRVRRKDQLAHLHESYRRLHNPHEYKVGVTSRMWQMKEQLLTAETV
jgi:nicotinate phosphoribosyltransferase